MNIIDLKEYRFCPYCNSKRGRYQRTSKNMLNWIMHIFRCDNCSAQFSEEELPNNVKIVTIDQVLNNTSKYTK